MNQLETFEEETYSDELFDRSNSNKVIFYFLKRVLSSTSKFQFLKVNFILIKSLVLVF